MCVCVCVRACVRVCVCMGECVYVLSRAFKDVNLGSLNSQRQSLSTKVILLSC